MEMTVQWITKLHDQQIQALSNQFDESSRYNNANQAGDDSDVNGHLNTDNPHVDQNAEGGPAKDNNAGSGPIIPPRDRLKKNTSEDEKMKDLESKINVLMTGQEVKKTSIPCPYPREWESILYLAKFSLINFMLLMGEARLLSISSTSHLGVISGNEGLMVWSFVGTFRGATFDWYRHLKPGSINSWDYMESIFRTNFFDDDIEVLIGTLFDEKPKGGESVDTFIKRFRNKAMNYRDLVSEEFILETCHNNLSLDILEAMGVALSKTWKGLKVRGKQVERFLKRKKTERGQPTVNPQK